MNYNTINDARTVAGNAEGALLAGRYRVVRQLGQGGMGSVWLAENTQLDNKLFAVKMLPSILVSNKRAYRQLKDEALVAMKLTHSNIVTLRAFEENDGNPFLVMDYIDGQTLDDYLAENGKLSEEETLGILRPIAAALDYAHSKGVVHRDVKPGNVMIAKDGTPYILDFGIAREIQETMTRVTGKLSSGTLLYMSPEQLRGAPPKAAQDVYSFAAMVYECLKGEPPFSRGQVEFQILSEPPPPLPDGVGIGSSVMSGLAKRPENRPKNCAAVLYVPQVQVGGARAPRPSSPKIGITAAPQRRNAPGIALAIAFAVAILAVLGGMLWHRGAQKREAVRSLAIAQRQAEEEKRQQEEESARQAEEAARKKAECEKDAREKEECERRRKAEELRLAAERNAREDAQRKAEEERRRAEDKKSKDEEAARVLLAELRIGIVEKVGTAKERIGQLAIYRGDLDGLFQEHIKTADRNWKIANDVKTNPQTIAEARLSLTQATEAASAIESELEWLKTNKANRDGAKAVEKAIAHDIVPELERFNASDYARSIYDEGEKLRREGNAALSIGDFKNAKSKLDSAKEKLSKAAVAAKKSCIDKHVKLANEKFEAHLWRQCVDECDKVLGWDGSNVTANQLKEEAENNLVPSAEIVIFVDGRVLGSGETVKIGNTPCTTPIKWGKDDIKEGITYYGKRVTYERGGRRYFGDLEAFTVNWSGLKRIRVKMTEDEGKSIEHGETKTITLPSGVTMEMIYVEPGSFTMGSPLHEIGRHHDETQRRVTLTKGYWLGKYEVTQKQWESVMGCNPSHFKGDNRPVENVSWEDCQKFIQKVNAQWNYEARLPTDVEWEYACRAGSTVAYGGSGNLNDMGWYSGNSGGVTHDVGQKSANRWGFYDMHGNVWEWCGNQYYAAGRYHVLRGGCWNSRDKFCRSAFLYRYRPTYLYDRDGFGFRLCFSAE